MAAEFNRVLLPEFQTRRCFSAISWSRSSGSWRLLYAPSPGLLPMHFRWTLAIGLWCTLIHPFRIMFPTVIYNVLMHNNAWCSKSNAFSLKICKVYTKRENAGSWNPGPKKATYELPFLHISTWAKKLQRIVLKYKKILEQITTRGGPPGEHKIPGRALMGCAQHGLPRCPYSGI